ncbi:MAG TPA: shikimate kinase [Clostridiales bacterium]|nr:shikimate kinase [Clostridiales bacterium]
MKKYALIGNPAGHSRSSAIFNSLFSKYEMECRYLAFSMKDSSGIMQMIRKYGFSGVNITSPFKEEVFNQLENTDNISKKIGAVNVVIKRNNSIYGLNTDVYGVEHSLVNNGIEVKGKKCIVVGAGGAAKAAVYAVKELGGDVFICNRTDHKAEKISSDLKCGCIKFDELKDQLINTYLMISAVPKIPEFLQGSLNHTIVLNANYSDESLRPHCKRYVSGFEWLIYQAAKSYEHFFDIYPDINEMKKSLEIKDERKNIALIGPTLSGKTTYGKIISDHYAMKFIDTDETVEKASGELIKEIFSSAGESGFRRLEEKALEEACSLENTVISVGAGALSSEKNRKILKESCYTVLLDIGYDVILSRINEEELTKRPMFGINDPESSWERMFASRKNDYVLCADIIVSVRTNDAEKESENIIREIDAGKHIYR